jgi:isopenicillin N synthase-like dioxygenase
LEVQTLDGLKWVKAPPLKGTIVVNIGDLLQFWSSGKYRATPHRVVVNSETCNQSRYSIAIFIHPNHDTAIRPLGKMIEKTTNQDNQTALEHIKRRFSETYTRA